MKARPQLGYGAGELSYYVVWRCDATLGGDPLDATTTTTTTPAACTVSG